MTQQLFIGVDGGATKSVVRIEDEHGKVIGQESSGPANIRLSVTETWDSINSAITRILSPHAITLDNKRYHFHIGLGLAGCEKVEAYTSLLNYRDRFNTFVVTSDAHTACLGAHGGKDGAIIIAGTGVVGFLVQNGKKRKVSGWGFPHDDEGGGAWIGLEAAKHTFQWIDGRAPESRLTSVIFRHFQDNLDYFVSWTNQANSTLFAQLAPLVIEESQNGDELAIHILKEAAAALDDVGEALLRAQSETSDPLPCALIGGIAPFVKPYLDVNLKARLRESVATPEMGAILLVRRFLEEHKEVE